MRKMTQVLFSVLCNGRHHSADAAGAVMVGKSQVWVGLGQDFTMRMRMTLSPILTTAGLRLYIFQCS